MAARAAFSSRVGERGTKTPGWSDRSAPTPGRFTSHRMPCSFRCAAGPMPLRISTVEVPKVPQASTYMSAVSVTCRLPRTTRTPCARPGRMSRRSTRASLRIVRFGRDRVAGSNPMRSMARSRYGSSAVADHRSPPVRVHSAWSACEPWVFQAPLTHEEPPRMRARTRWAAQCRSHTSSRGRALPGLPHARYGRRGEVGPRIGGLEEMLVRLRVERCGAPVGRRAPDPHPADRRPTGCPPVRRSPGRRSVRDCTSHRPSPGVNRTPVTRSSCTTWHTDRRRHHRDRTDRQPAAPRYRAIHHSAKRSESARYPIRLPLT